MTAIQKAREALDAARGALATCYNVCEWPANGGTEQDRAIGKIDAALAALDGETEGWRTDAMPSFERVMVAGWQPRSGTTQGYWWYGEDATDDKGTPIDHPAATLWIRLTDLLPAFPPEARS